jgi:hypothetical protein
MQQKESTTMETTTLDTIARTLSGTTTRRSAIRGLFAGAAALVAGGALLQTEDASAKRRKKSKKSKTTQPATDQPQNGGTTPLLPPGSRCQSSSQCQATYICEVPVNGSNSDRYCSGGPGAICGAPNGDGDDTAPFCAVGHRCTLTGSTYTCQAVPDEI